MQKIKGLFLKGNSITQVSYGGKDVVQSGRDINITSDSNTSVNIKAGKDVKIDNSGVYVNGVRVFNNNDPNRKLNITVEGDIANLVCNAPLTVKGDIKDICSVDGPTNVEGSVGKDLIVDGPTTIKGDVHGDIKIDGPVTLRSGFQK